MLCSFSEIDKYNPSFENKLKAVSYPHLTHSLPTA